MEAQNQCLKASPGKRAWPREGCGLLTVCCPLRARIRSGPLLGPPLLGVWLVAQLQMIASGGGSAEVRTFEAWPLAMVGGAEVSLKLGSEVSPTRGTAGGGLGERPGASPASPSRRRGARVIPVQVLAGVAAVCPPY